MRGGWDEEWWQTLNKLGMVGERERQQYLAQKNGMAFADLDRIKIDPATLALIPIDLARELRVLPVKRDGNTLWLALDSVGIGAIDRVKEATGMRVIPVMCVGAALDDALGRLPDHGA